MHEKFCWTVKVKQVFIYLFLLRGKTLDGELLSYCYFKAANKTTSNWDNNFYEEFYRF